MPDKKQAKEIPRVPGIYQIHCKLNGKIYIGSAVNLHARWGLHRRRLRQKTHHNIHLQQAWNKYGEENFEFSVLELVEVSALLQAEQTWIDKTGCADRKIGFNIFPLAGSPGNTFVQVWEGFVDPDGNEVTIKNLFDFCRQNGLDFPSMHRLAKGRSKLKSYKGWTHKNSVRRRDYVKTYDGFIDPGGQPVGTVTNLAAFCREYGLDKTHMVAVANGRLGSHRGWTHQAGKKKLEPKKYTGFIAPDGKRLIITNLKAFCQQQGLSVVHMHKVKSGQRKSHKGWTWREDEDHTSQ
jgi:group I intron endonuclease